MYHRCTLSPAQLGLHALVAEVYLSKRPSAQGAPAPTVGVRLSGP